MNRGSKIGLTALLVAAGLASSQLRAQSLLIISCDAGFLPSPRNELLALGFFSTIDDFDATIGVGSTPTLAQLNGYDAVLAYTDFPPNDATALGNVLADYVDAGGKVVVSTFGFSTDPIFDFAIHGRIMTPGYSPLVNLAVDGDVSGNLVAVVPGDPIFNGVDLSSLTYYHNDIFAHPGLDSGATLLATDGAGVNMIARNAAHNVMGVNLFPAGGDFGGNSAELYQLVNTSMANLLAPIPTPVPDAGRTWLLLGLGCFGLASLGRRLAANPRA